MTLIEVLIAILLLSFGLLGMIGLKMVSLKHTGQSNARALASVHATEMLDRLRANPVRALAGSYTLALTAPTPTVITSVADLDLRQWRLGIEENLGGGTGSVEVQADGFVRIVVQWTERAEQGSDARDLSFTFEARI